MIKILTLSLATLMIFPLSPSTSEPSSPQTKVPVSPLRALTLSFSKLSRTQTFPGSSSTSVSSQSADSRPVPCKSSDLEYLLQEVGPGLSEAAIARIEGEIATLREKESLLLTSK